MLIEKVFAAEESKSLFKQFIGEPNPTRSLDGLINATTTLIRIALDMAGMVAVIMFLYASYLLVTSYGDDTKAENAKKTIFTALNGLLLIALGLLIVRAIDGWISSGLPTDIK